MSDDDHILKKHSIVIAGHHTSITLENIFWRQLKQIAKARKLSLSNLVSGIDTQRIYTQGDINLSSTIRVFILKQHLKA